MHNNKLKKMENLSKEVWKDIRGYESRYQVSNMGNVRNLHFHSKNLTTKDNGVREIKKVLKSTGYYVVSLHKNGIQRQCHVHRLVAEAFIENTKQLPVVDHINTIKTDNRIENLRWVSIKDNVNNPISSERRLNTIRKLLVGKFGVLANKHRAIAQYDLNGEFVKLWECMSDAWKELGIDSGCLTRACQGVYKTAGGFIWKYINNETKIETI